MSQHRVQRNLFKNIFILHYVCVDICTRGPNPLDLELRAVEFDGGCWELSRSSGGANVNHYAISPALQAKDLERNGSNELCK